MRKFLFLLLVAAFILSFPVPIPSATDTFGVVTYCTGEQDLSAASLTLNCTSPAGKNTRLAFVTVHASGATTETIDVTLDYKLTDNYDTLLKTKDWSANTDYLWEPEGNIILRVNDIIKLTVTNNNTSNTVYATIALEEVTWTR